MPRRSEVGTESPTVAVTPPEFVDFTPVPEDRDRLFQLIDMFHTGAAAVVCRFTLLNTSGVEQTIQTSAFEPGGPTVPPLTGFPCKITPITVPPGARIRVRAVGISVGASITARGMFVDRFFDQFPPPP